MESEQSVLLAAPTPMLGLPSLCGAAGSGPRIRRRGRLASKGLTG